MKSDGYKHRYDWELTDAEREERAAVVAILKSHTTEMEGYSYYGSNPGIPEDSYDEVAGEVIELLRARLADMKTEGRT